MTARLETLEIMARSILAAEGWGLLEARPLEGGLACAAAREGTGELAFVQADFIGRSCRPGVFPRAKLEAFAVETVAQRDLPSGCEKFEMGRLEIETSGDGGFSGILALQLGGPLGEASLPDVPAESLASGRQCLDFARKWAERAGLEIMRWAMCGSRTFVELLDGSRGELSCAQVAGTMDQTGEGRRPEVDLPALRSFAKAGGVEPRLDDIWFWVIPGGKLVFRVGRNVTEG